MSEPELWKRAVHSGLIRNSTSILVTLADGKAHAMRAGDVAVLHPFLRELDKSAQDEEHAAAGVEESPIVAEVPDALIPASPVAIAVSGMPERRSARRGASHQPARFPRLIIATLIGVAMLAILAVALRTPMPSPSAVSGYLDRTANLRSEPRSDRGGTISRILGRGESVSGVPDAKHPDWLRIESPSGSAEYVKRDFVAASAPPRLDAGTARWRTLRAGTILYPGPVIGDAGGAVLGRDRRVYVVGTTGSAMEVIHDGKILYLKK